MEHLQVAIEASEAGCKVLLKYWGKLESIKHKSSTSDLVTEADQESEKAIIGVIKKYYPTHSVLAEESGLEGSKTAPFLWVIDPLDGTTNYTHMYPMFAVSIALWHEGKPIVGVVYNPMSKELFHASLNQGAFLNNERLHVSATQKLAASLLATGFAYDRQKSPETNYKEFTYFTHLTQGVRRGGSAALDLCFVASGRLDGYWERGLQPWDLAAGSLLVTEAGGQVTAYDRTPFDLYSGKVLASNGHIHPLISQELMKLSRT